MFSPLIHQLIEGLRCLPGIGPKSAQRMAFHLLERQRDNGLELAKILTKALSEIGHCKRCRIFAEEEICSLCANPQRNSEILCIVETPVDVLAIEQTNSYRGLYYVLMGHLSPLDGIGPQEIGIDQLMELMQREKPREVILATNPTVEGEATAHYIATLLKKSHIHCTRIAHGVPLDGELGYLDGGTLTRAITARTTIINAIE